MAVGKEGTLLRKVRAEVTDSQRPCSEAGPHWQQQTLAANATAPWEATREPCLSQAGQGRSILSLVSIWTSQASLCLENQWLRKASQHWQLLVPVWNTTYTE